LIFLSLAQIQLTSRNDHKYAAIKAYQGIDWPAVPGRADNNLATLTLIGHGFVFVI